MSSVVVVTEPEFRRAEAVFTREPPCSVSSHRRRKPSWRRRRALPARGMRSSGRSSTAANCMPRCRPVESSRATASATTASTRRSPTRGGASLHEHAGCAPPVGGGAHDAADSCGRAALRAGLAETCAPANGRRGPASSCTERRWRSSAAARSDAPPRTSRRRVSACALSAIADLPLHRKVTGSSTRSRPTSAKLWVARITSRSTSPRHRRTPTFINEDPPGAAPRDTRGSSTRHAERWSTSARSTTRVAAERIGGRGARRVREVSRTNRQLPDKDLRTLPRGRTRAAHRQQHRGGERPHGRACVAERHPRRARRCRGDGSAQSRSRFRTSANVAGQTVLPLARSIR